MTRKRTEVYLEESGSAVRRGRWNLYNVGEEEVQHVVARRMEEDQECEEVARQLR